MIQLLIVLCIVTFILLLSIIAVTHTVPHTLLDAHHHATTHTRTLVTPPSCPTLTRWLGVTAFTVPHTLPDSLHLTGYPHTAFAHGLLHLRFTFGCTLYVTHGSLPSILVAARTFGFTFFAALLLRLRLPDLHVCVPFDLHSIYGWLPLLLLCGPSTSNVCYY